LSISTQKLQSLTVDVLQPKLFITTDMKFLLDGQPNYQLSKSVPPQLASQADLKRTETTKTVTQTTGGVSILMTITVSIVAQRALKHIWVFFAALQVIIMFSLNSNYLPPASA
jgi:hypothetical protein